MRNTDCPLKNTTMKQHATTKTPPLSKHQTTTQTRSSKLKTQFVELHPMERRKKMLIYKTAQIFQLSLCDLHIIGIVSSQLVYYWHYFISLSIYKHLILTRLPLPALLFGSVDGQNNTQPLFVIQPTSTNQNQPLSIRPLYLVHLFIFLYKIQYFVFSNYYQIYKKYCLCTFTPNFPKNNYCGLSLLLLFLLFIYFKIFFSFIYFILRIYYTQFVCPPVSPHHKLTRDGI